MRAFLIVGAAVSYAVADRASAQELATYSVTWSEVVAGTNQPVASPNGVLEPGEGIRVAVRVAFSPPVGSPASYTPPPPPGTGTIAGLGSIFIDVLGTNLLGGTWSNLTSNAAANPGGIPGAHNWSLGGTGDAQANGDIINIGAGQFVLPGSTAVSTNPIDNIWRGTWTPSNFSNRFLSFRTAGAVASGGLHTSLLIQYGTDPQGDPQYVGKFIPAEFGSSGTIPLTPAPSGIAVLALAAAVPARRRR